MSKRHFFPILGPPKRIFKFHSLFVHPRPEKRENPTRLKDFWGGSAAGARPRVAKAMLASTTNGVAGFKRLRATAGQGPNYVGPFCGYVGLCWPMLAYVGLSCGQCGPILWLCWPMLGSWWPMLSRKSRKMGTAKKHWKTQDILMVGGLSWGYVGPSWGYVGPSLAHLGAMLAHLGGYAGPSWGYVGPSWGLCWPMLTHSRATRAEKVQKTGRAQNTVKRGTFWRYREVGGWGGGPSLLGRGENCRTARTRPGGPWTDLSAYARQPARGPTMLAHLVAMPAYVDLSCGKCGPSLSWRLCGPILRPMSADLEAYVGPCWPILSQKDPKNGNSKNHCKTQDILMVGGLSWAMLADLGAMLAYLEGNLGPSWGWEGRLVLNVAFWSHEKTVWKAPRMLQKPLPRAPRSIWLLPEAREASA